MHEAFTQSRRSACHDTSQKLALGSLAVGASAEMALHTALSLPQSTRGQVDKKFMLLLG